MTTTVMMRAQSLDGDPCSGHMLVDDVHGACLMWWSPDDGDGVCLMMMQLGDAMMMPYVFIVFIDACGWIPCLMIPWSHGSHSSWRWLLDEFWPCC
jgi:hypothetical protein